MATRLGTGLADTADTVNECKKEEWVSVVMENPKNGARFGAMHGY
jgi:hypothetical protein